MSSVSGNSWIDDELKNVAVPNDLTAKLRAIPSLFATDPQLDRALNDVPSLPGRLEVVSEQLTDRLRAIGSLEDQDLDDELRHVALPIDLRSRLWAIVDEPTVGRWDRILDRPLFNRPAIKWMAANARALSIAASLLLAAGVGYLTAIVASDMARGGRDAVAPQNVGPINTIAGGNRQPSSNDPARPGNSSTGSQQIVAQSPNGKSGNGLVDDPANADFLIESSDAATNPSALVGVTPADSLPHRNGSQNDPAFREPVRDPLDNTAVGPNRNADTLFGGTPGTDLLPQLRSVAEPVWRGIIPPRVRGYDLTFQLRHGVHPFVSPASNKSLESCPVPVVTSTASFDSAAQAVAARKLPPAYRIRTEEFLAAMDYQFPLPTAGKPVAIRTAAGPSPWTSGANGGLSLMQVAVQAGSLPRDTNSPTHLVVLLDRSISMQTEGRWQTAVRGLTEFARQMTPRDRVSLITFADKSEPLIVRATAAEMPAAIQKLQQQTPAGAGDLLSALTMGVDIVKSLPAEAKKSDNKKLTTRMVLITDGVTLGAAGLGSTELEGGDLNRGDASIERTLSAANAAGARLDVIDVRQDETLDSQLAVIAAAGQPGVAAMGVVSGAGQVRHAGNADRLRWELLEVLTDRSQVVAADVSIKVTFKPDSVAMYRLLGHEATSVVGLMSTSIQADLRSGEAATGLFEVALIPDGAPTVAVVEVSWLDTKTGQPQTSRQTISRMQFAPSLVEAPFSLQLAALAAETAEILRDSYFAPPNAHSLAEVAELGRQLNSRLRARPSFVRLMALIEQAQRSQSAGN